MLKAIKEVCFFGVGVVVLLVVVVVGLGVVVLRVVVVVLVEVLDVVEGGLLTKGGK